MKPRDLACFENVASVIGNDAAEVELQKVIECDCASLVHEEEFISGAFHWAATPQGHIFWYDINNQAG